MDTDQVLDFFREHLDDSIGERDLVVECLVLGVELRKNPAIDSSSVPVAHITVEANPISVGSRPTARAPSSTKGTTWRSS